MFSSSFNEFYRVLLGFTWFYRVFFLVNWVLPSWNGLFDQWSGSLRHFRGILLSLPQLWTRLDPTFLFVAPVSTTCRSFIICLLRKCFGRLLRPAFFVIERHSHGGFPIVPSFTEFFFSFGFCRLGLRSFCRSFGLFVCLLVFNSFFLSIFAV